MNTESDVTPVETAGSRPLLLLAGFAVAWLLASGLLALIASIQVHTPGFMDACPVFSYGRARALQDTAFTYGWLANAGLAVVLWILGRLSAEPLRAARWIVVGALFWNLALAMGLVGIATGGSTSIPMLEMPATVQPILLLAYGAIGVAGILAWTGRRRDMMFAAHWYAVAALFLFPWILSVAQVMLLWDPVRGVLQAIVGGWFAQSMWTLWIAPFALAGAYYVVPRVTGKVLPAYDLSTLGFWCLLFIGGWTGGRHLIGGPAPAWISTVAIVTSTILLTHYLVVFLNLSGSFSGGGSRAGCLKFIAIGVAADVLGGVVDACTAVRAVAAVTQFTWFDEAQRQLALYGGASMMLFGSLYFAVPRLAGRPWSSGALLKGHFTLSFLGVALLVVSLGAAGLVQGHDLGDAHVSFADIAAHTHTWLLLATAAQAILLLGNLMLAVNLVRTSCPRSPVAVAMEALST